MPISSAACLPDLPLEGAREADEPLPVPDKARSPLTLPDLPLDLALEAVSYTHLTLPTICSV